MKSFIAKSYLDDLKRPSKCVILLFQLSVCEDASQEQSRGEISWKCSLVIYEAKGLSSYCKFPPDSLPILQCFSTRMLNCLPPKAAVKCPLLSMDKVYKDAEEESACQRTGFNSTSNICGINVVPV